MTNSKLYICECGCDLEFIDYHPGLDVSIGSGFIMSENAMTEYVWNDFVPMNGHKTWLELKTYIINKYNDVDLKEWQPFYHLYQRYMNNENIPFPLNETLYYECAF